jgi:hypothetical protein
MKTFAQRTAWGTIVDGLYLTDLKTLQVCRMEDGFEEPWCTAAATISDLREGEVAIKDYGENQGILCSLVAMEIVKPPHRYIGKGMVFFPICFINEAVAREYMRG